jgi:hypothetical protein
MQSYSRLRIPVFEHNFPFAGINYFIYDNDTIHIKAFVTSRGEEEELMKEETRAPFLLPRGHELLSSSLPLTDSMASLILFLSSMSDQSIL